MKKEKINIGICIPTYNRKEEILKRTIISALSNISFFTKEENELLDFTFLVKSDSADKEESVLNVLNDLFEYSEKESNTDVIHYIDKKNPNLTVHYSFLGYHSNNFANSPRQSMIDELEKYNIDFVLFLDDDNIIFPEYIKTSLNLILNDKVDFVCSDILHLGPLPSWHGTPPKILGCDNLTVQNCDTLQFFLKASIIIESGWNKDQHYLADGYTFEKIAKKYPYSKTNKLLGIHI